MPGIIIKTSSGGKRTYAISREKAEELVSAGKAEKVFNGLYFSKVLTAFPDTAESPDFEGPDVAPLTEPAKDAEQEPPPDDMPAKRKPGRPKKGT